MTKTTAFQATFITALLVLSSCQWFKGKDKKSSKATPPKEKTYEVLIEDSVFFTRSSDAKIGFLSFKSAVPAHCVLFFASESQLAAAALPEEAFDSRPCSNESPGTFFNERLEGINPTERYTIKLSIWSHDSTQEKAEEFEGKEADFISANNEIPQFGEMLVARVDYPLQTASVHRHVFGSAEESANIVQTIEREEGCQTPIPDLISPYSTPNPIVKVKGLITKGYANAGAFSNPLDASSLVLSFDNFQLGDKWEWSYAMSGVYLEFISLPVSNLRRITATSFDELELEQPRLTQSPKTLQFRSGSSLTLKWQAQNLLNRSNLLVMIGTQGAEDSIFCSFDASEGEAVVNADTLKGLKSDEYRVMVYLESKQFQRVPGSLTHFWHIRGYDWRTFKMLNL